MKLAFLIAHLLSAALWGVLRKLPPAKRFLVALGVFIALSVGFTVVVISVGDPAGPGARTWTQEELDKAAQPKGH